MSKNKPKAPVIPITKNVAQPKIEAPQGASIMDWVNEVHARLRQMNAHMVATGEIMDRLINEIIKRDDIISKHAKANP